ncbi:MAG: hypothetical protein KC933_04635 [Myxococcales bacterium]|nr:hypothetical protein [Myxococcales bacterium]
MAEMELAIEGDDQAVHRKQGRRLEVLEAFARDHRGEGARFADLLLEVQLRRVRLFIAQDRRADAVSEARAAQRTLEVRRGRRAVTPTFLYAEAVQNLALAGADWPVQLVLRMAGLRADGARGARALKVLLAKDSAYGLEVRYLARTFAVSPDADTRGPLAYSAELHRRFPANPQLAFDHAVDLLEAKKPAEAAAALAEPLARLTAQPDTWSARIRAKLYWAAGRAALDEGKRHEAERLAERAAREAPPDVRDRVRSLKEALAR